MRIKKLESEDKRTGIRKIKRKRKRRRRGNMKRKRKRKDGVRKREEKTGGREN